MCCVMCVCVCSKFTNKIYYFVSCILFIDAQWMKDEGSLLACVHTVWVLAKIIARGGKALSPSIIVHIMGCLFVMVAFTYVTNNIWAHMFIPVMRMFQIQYLAERW